VRCEALFAGDATRAADFSARAAGMLLDYSKHGIDREARAALFALARSAGLEAAIARLFAGEKVNRSESRPALHMALRGGAPDAADTAVVAQAKRAAHATLERLCELAEALRTGGLSDSNPVEDIVHVGIGGSELGPRLAYEALVGQARAARRIHFVANVDGHAVARLTATLDPRRTLVVLVSKTFSTQETLLNGEVLRRWLGDRLGSEAAAERLLAVSANTAAVARFGIAPERTLPIWDWVGGRYSLWSAVGFSLALALGADAFRALLAGAAALDAHFRSAPLEQNLPVLMALIGIWQRNLCARPTLCVVPYDDRLQALPSYLQQLDMESNGKRVTPLGVPTESATAPVIWGGVGTNVQHAFFQALHQGTDVVPVDFIGVIAPDHALGANHAALLANLFAQSAAMMRGRRLESSDAALDRQRDCPGDRPSSTLLLDRLTPSTLGALIALYEHKVYTQSVLWGINAFDQWGVELGKSLANQLLPALADPNATIPADLDGSSAALIAAVRAAR
jgi:glucose-6-phosphate isomerase